MLSNKLKKYYILENRIKELQEIAESRGYGKKPIEGAPAGSQYMIPYTDFLTPKETKEYNKFSRELRKLKAQTKEQSRNILL